MTPERQAIYAALPVLQVAIKGDLPSEIALAWVEHILMVGLKEGND